MYNNIFIQQEAYAVSLAKNEVLKRIRETAWQYVKKWQIWEISRKELFYMELPLIFIALFYFLKEQKANVITMSLLAK